MNAQQVTARFDALFNAIKARNAAQVSKDNDIVLSYMFKHEKTIKAGMVKFPAALFDQYIANATQHDAKACARDSFVAVKVNVKIVRMLDAIGRGAIACADEYSQTIIANALHNDGKIISKAALVCLSSNIEFNELDQTQVIKNRMRKAATTASTQRSSTREMLRILDLAACNKGAKGDDITLTEKGRTLIEPLFA
jgi:hypothetical protein